METYTTLRHLADSWGVVFMLVAFGLVLAWAFRPGGSKAQHDAAMQIFRNEDAPKED